MNPFTLKRFTLTSLMMLAAAGCGGPTTPDEQPQVEVEDPEVEENWDAQEQATLASTVQGAYLFTLETFKGNGRSCATCHTVSSGTLSPSQVKAAWSRNHNDPLFRKLDSDTGNGASYSKLQNDATVTVDIALPPNVRLANSTARTVTLRRGVPSVFDMPHFDPVIMLDGREPSLQSQATHAIAGHAQGGRVPTTAEQNALVDFEKVLFSSAKMAGWAITGKPPALPTGKTASEKRGAAFFTPTGLCGSCHGGPLLNSISDGNPFGLPPGFRFMSVAVSEINEGGAPPQDFIVTAPDGSESHVVSPDPGMMLVTGDPQTAGFFKMTSLRNIKNTAPYFHDNSAKTLEQVVAHYKLLFSLQGIPLSDQDAADLVAYMKLL